MVDCVDERSVARSTVLSWGWVLLRFNSESPPSADGGGPSRWGSDAGHCLSIGARESVSSCVRGCGRRMAVSPGPEHPCCTYSGWRRQRGGRPYIGADRATARCARATSRLRLVNFTMDRSHDVRLHAFE